MTSNQLLAGAGTRRPRLQALDGLRGLAAFAVVIYHYGFRAAEIYPGIGDPISAVIFGQYGVQLFFLISGFVIFLTLQRATLKSFVYTRFLRLYPIYWVCGFMTFSAVAVFGLAGREASLPEAIVNLSMLQGYLGVTPIDGSYWTLAAELGFYVQVAVLYFAGLLSG